MRRAAQTGVREQGRESRPRWCAHARHPPVLTALGRTTAIVYDCLVGTSMWLMLNAPAVRRIAAAAVGMSARE